MGQRYRTRGEIEVPHRRTMTVVLPCLNEEEVLPRALSRIGAVIARDFGEWSVEVLIIDDGSIDSTVAVATNWEPPPHTRLHVLEFSRNFGHQAAISAGIEEATGEVIAILDADLQDPPELLGQMVSALDDGYDVVSGKRISRQGVGIWKRGSYSLFYRLLRATVTHIDIPLDTGDFRVISRRAADALKAMPERNRFVRGLLPFTGLPQTSIEYERQAREAGAAKYTLTRLIALAFDGLFSFSTRPLRVALYLGAALFVLSILGATTVIIDRLATDDWAPGWAGTLVVLLSFGGIQFLFLGIIGEYIGKIFDEVKARPSYLIAARHDGKSPYRRSRPK